VATVAASSQRRLSLLGGFSLTAAGEVVRLPGNAQRLLAFVALQGRAVSRARVAFTLWPDGTEAHAYGSLRSALFELRRPGHDLLRVNESQAQLAPGVAVDAHELLALLDVIGSGWTAGLEPAVPRRLLEAELLTEWYDDWVQVERERWLELRLQALETLCRLQLDAGLPSEAVATGLAAVRADPTRESSARLVIAAQLAMGNQAQAMAHYRHLEAGLRELGLVPSAVTMALVSSIASSLTLG
jgi:DNA-binding SARP family transcriptional activator